MTRITLTSDLTVELIDVMGGDLSILKAMMVSTQGSLAEGFVENLGEEEIDGRLRFLMRNRHGSPFEHGALTLRVHAPIAVFREWHRHRIGFSYNEESGRYKQLEPVFYVPPPERPLTQVGKPGAYTMLPGNTPQYDRLVARLTRTFEHSYGAYLESLADGVAREVARGCLPVYIYSSMYVTCNPRSIMSFLQLRTDEPDSVFPSKPMWEIERCARQVEAAFAEIWPRTYAAWQENGRVAP